MKFLREFLVGVGLALFVLAAAWVFVLSLNGCATAPDPRDPPALERSLSGSLPPPR